MTVNELLLPEDVRGLAKLDARAMEARLKRYVEALGGLLTAADVELARECVRRSRAAEGAAMRAGRLEGLERLDAQQLTARLAAYLQAAGPAATEAERALARELVRRARRAERVDEGPRVA